MNDPVQQITTIVSSLGGGAVLMALVRGLIKWFSGAAHREQLRNTTLESQRTKAIKERDEAETERDDEARMRREAEEHVSILKRQIRELGAIPQERPDTSK